MVDMKRVLFILVELYCTVLPPHKWQHVKL